MKKTFLICLFIFAGTVYAQQIECTYCGGVIKSNYLIVEGKAYHPEHFFCAKCLKPIEGEYLKDSDKFYHPRCLSPDVNFVCDVCQKPIRGTYISSNGKNYHESCYHSHVLPKCAVCGKTINGEFIQNGAKKYHKECYSKSVAEKCAICGEPLLGNYLIDASNNKYHIEHEKTLKRCDNCNQPISLRTTSGGVTYPDGRNICMTCKNSAVNGYFSIKSLFNKVARKLSEYGLNIDVSSITIKAADRNELKSAAGKNYMQNMKGYCSTVVKEITDGSKTIIERKHTIFILDGVPSDYIESTIAHEIMHVWISQNTNIDHSLELEEGSCNYISYIYLKNNRFNSSALQLILDDPDPIYGGGFRKVKSKFDLRPLADLLNYLREKRSI